MKRGHVAIAAGRFLLDALSGRLGVPIMVTAYVVFSVLLLGYVSTQVYTSTLMEDVAQRRRTKLALDEHIGVLMAQYSTMTSKSRISQQCEQSMGMVSSTMNDVVRVAVRESVLPGPEPEQRIRVNEVLGNGMNDISQVVHE